MAIERDGDGPPLHRDDAKPRSSGGGDDLRATPFTDDVFNEDYYDRRPATSKGGRSFSLIAGVVIGLAIVGGVAWYALKGGAMSRLLPGEPQVVEADSSPYKIKPENPGGMQVENQDKLVYDRVAKGAAPNRVENLLPPAEEPKAPPQKPKTPEPEVKPEPPKAEVASADAEKKSLEAMVKAAQDPAKAPEAPPAAQPPQTEAPKAAPPKPVQVAEAPKAEPPKPAEAPKPAAEPKPDAAKPDPLVAAVAAATGKPAEAPKAETPPVKTAALTSAPSSVAGAFQIQLVSVPSEEAANAEWKRITRRHQDLFASLSPSVTKAELPEKGTVYRLRAGPLADKAAADALCASLAAEKTGCIVIKP